MTASIIPVQTSQRTDASIPVRQREPKIQPLAQPPTTPLRTRSRRFDDLF